MDIQEFDYLMTNRGWARFPGIVDKHLVEEICAELDNAVEKVNAIRQAKGLQQNTDGIAHHLIGMGKSFDKLFINCPLLSFIEHALGGSCILNSYSGSTNPPGKNIYTRNVHRDIRGYFDGMLMINMIVLLEDATAENGATLLLEGSHHIADKPDAELFSRHAARLTGQAGDVILFDSKAWHAAGENTSQTTRKILTLTFTRPYFKPQFDYVRSIGEETARNLPPKAKQLIGFYARIPATHDEWYRESSDRFYQAEI